jgi:hypothetical protein
MPDSAKNLPRFIPTLTEVVHAPIKRESTPQYPEQPGKKNPEEINSALQSSLRALVDEVVAVQLAELRPRLVVEINRVLQERLGELVAAKLANLDAN